MSKKISRPPAVWITQVVLLIFGCIWGFLGVVTVFFTLTSQSDIGLSFGMLIASGMSLLFAAAAFAGFWGLMKRKSYGRTIGIVLLSLMLLGGVLGMISRPQGPVQNYEYKNNAERAGGFLGELSISCLVALLLYGLALGKRSKDFFSPVETGEAESPPPPPPNFADEK